MSGTELAIVLVLALLLLGPSKLPELARTMGKAVRDFKRTTNDIRSSVESEFYRMDEPEKPAQSLPTVTKVEGSVAASSAPAPSVPAPTPAAPAAAQPEGKVPAVYLPEANDPSAKS